MSALPSDALVIGAGISGLAAATELRRAGLEVRVLEGAERAGGVVRSERIRGYLVERGPNTVRIKAPMVTFLEEHGLAPRMQPAQPESRLRFVVQDGRLLPLPLGPVAFARTPLLSTRGKLRLLAEPFVRRGDPSGESVAAFARRRLGDEALERLVAPFLTGVYAGDETRLGAEAVFPTLVEAERDHGSIVRGLVRRAMRRAQPRPWPGIWSTEDGLEGLTEALAKGLGASLSLRSPVREIAHDGKRFRVECDAPGGATRLEADALVLAVPAREGGALLSELDSEAAKEMAAVDYAPVVSVSLGVDPTRVRQPLQGFGFLVPSREGGALLGCLFPSCLFPGRAPSGRTLLTALLGGTRRPDLIELGEAELVACVHEELDRFLGLRDTPELLAVTRWPRAVAQPGPDHPRLLQRVRGRLAAFPRLALAGSYLEGVAVSDAVEAGVRAAACIAPREP